MSLLRSILDCVSQLTGCESQASLSHPVTDKSLPSHNAKESPRCKLLHTKKLEKTGEKVEIIVDTRFTTTFSLFLKVLTS